MPTFSRKQLRQLLGRSYIRDMISTNSDSTVASLPTEPAGTFKQIFYADLSLSGQGLYAGAYIRHLVDDNDYRVATFNAGSGAWMTLQTVATPVSITQEFEVHSRLSAAEKDLMIDDTIKRIRLRQEVGIPTGTAGQDFFSIESAATPNYITDVLDAYWFANPTGTLDRDLRRFDDIRLVTTATGRELRVAPAPGGSAQLVLDAILQPLLLPYSTATINLPDDRWVLAGAAAGCYNLIIQNTPGQNAGELANRRTEWAREFTKLSGNFAPLYSKKIRLEEPEDQTAWPNLPTW